MKLEMLRELAGEVAHSRGTAAQAAMERALRDRGLDPGSVYQELEMTSSLVDTHRDISWSNEHLQLHSHSFFELLWCVGCRDVEYLVGTERYKLQPGDLIFVPPGISHRPLLPERVEEPYVRFVLWISVNFLERFASLFPYPLTGHRLRPNMLRTGGTRWERLGELFLEGVLESEQRQDGWEAAVVGNTLTLLAQIKRATDDRTARALEAEQPELLDRILAHVEEHYREELTIGALAERFYVSPSTVSHLCKQKLGVSLHRLLTQRRLIGAKSLIDRGVPLEEVARQVGFRDYSGFYRAFRQEYGISPRQYRQL